MALVDRAARKAVTPALRARFLSLVEKAEARGQSGVARRLVKIADKNGDEALSLVAKYHQMRIPEVQAALDPLAGFPLFKRHETYISDLVAGKTPLQGSRLLQEIQAHSDVHSGTHRLAKALEGLSGKLPSQPVQQAWQKGFGYYAEQNVLSGSIALADTEVAARTAQVVGRLGNLSAEELKAASSLLAGMPGVTEAAQLHLKNAGEQVTGLAPKLMKKPGALGSFFGRGPKADEAVAEQIKTAYKQGISRVGEMTVPKAEAAAPLADAAAVQRKLLEDLLNHKINKTEEWKVFSSETWLKFQETGTHSSNGRIAGSQASSGVNLLFAKAQESSFGGSIAQAGSSSTEGKLVKAIDLPIPNTDAHAPMVTVRHILQNPGDYILVSGGKLHAVNGADIDGWFQVAEKEIRNVGRLIGTR